MTSAPLVGATMIFITVVVDSLVIAVGALILNRFENALAGMNVMARIVVILSPLSLWLLFAGIGAALWLWSGLLVVMGEFETLPKALYFTSVSATTLGYGDILLSERWQLLSGFIAANGLLLFSLNTAFLFEALRRSTETA